MSERSELARAARAVRWRWVLGGYAATVAIGALFARILVGAGAWSAGFEWENDLLVAWRADLPPALDLILLVLPWFGTNITLLPAVLLASVWLIRRRGRPELALHLMVVEAGSLTLTAILKGMFGRPRPELWEWRGQYAWTAFPSGHAIAGVAVLFTVAMLLHHERGWTWPYAAAALLLVTNLYSRLYLGVHWPTDVIAGAMMGASWLFVTWVAFQREQVA